MLFVVGGIGSGKREFVLAQLGFSEQDISSDPLDDCPVFWGLQNLVRENGTPSDEVYAALLQKEVVICDEVGSGVVPLDINERRWRDEVGRAASLLAREAQTVVRMVCGIPQVIKGTIGNETL